MVIESARVPRLPLHTIFGSGSRWHMFISAFSLSLFAVSSYSSLPAYTWQNGDVVAILTAPFLPLKPAFAEGGVGVTALKGMQVANDAPFHVHTGVWPWSMGFPVNQEGAPETFTEIDEIPEMTQGERRLAREVELKHARLRSGGASSVARLRRDLTPVTETILAMSDNSAATVYNQYSYNHSIPRRVRREPGSQREDVTWSSSWLSWPRLSLMYAWYVYLIARLGSVS